MIDKTHKDWPHAGPALAHWIDPGGLLLILEILHWHLAAHLDDAKLARKLVRTIAMASKEAWQQAQYNINLQIREFVLSCPGRRAFVRSVIGEAAIKRWETRDAGKYEQPADKPENTNSKPRTAPKSYQWKPYALPEIRIMFKPSPHETSAFSEWPELLPLPQHPRAKRGFQPAVFAVRELSPGYQHVREKPDPIRAVQARKSERLRADFSAKQGWPPATKDEAQHGSREIINAQYKPP